MNPLRIILIFLLSLFCLPTDAATEQRSDADLLRQLDSVISHRERFIEKKEERLSRLRKDYRKADSDRRRFDILRDLFGEYQSYNSDSAYSITLEEEALAGKIGDRVLLMDARLNKANILNAVGMYDEARNTLDSVDTGILPEYLKPYYFHTCRTLYGNLEAAAAFGPERKKYERLTDIYRDSLLSVNDPSTLFHALIKADQLNIHNKPREAIDLLTAYLDTNEVSDHERAICAYTLSESYRQIDDIPNQKHQLLISAIADMQSAVREYVSLRQLALLLYREGDLDRAYRFMNIALEDAAKSNARQRIVELNDSYPAINSIYVKTISNQKRTLEWTILIITVLSILLIILLFYMRKQMVRITEGRQKVEEANGKLSTLNDRLQSTNDRLNELNLQLRESNDKLNDLNSELVSSNGKLQKAYTSIAEISELKEVYICQYMDRSLEYIEILDQYRKSIGKLINSGKSEELKTLVKSSKIVDDELKSFYSQFDTTFLNLFPTFVEDFNALLLPEEAIIPKREGSLNTELRIYALIRLGITDSDKIARFLRYSLTTIYNYRTKVRNKARGDRNLLEKEIARIGQHTPANPSSETL